MNKTEKEESKEMLDEYWNDEAQILTLLLLQNA